MRIARPFVLGIVVVSLASTASRADALGTLPVDKCLAGQLRLIAKAAAAYATCRAKAATKGRPVDTQCLGKATATFAGAFAKLEDKRTCRVEGAVVTFADRAFSYAENLEATVGHAAGKCDGAKIQFTGKYVAALAGCYVKAALETATIDAACVGKAAAKLVAQIAKAEERADCSATGQFVILRAGAINFVYSTTCNLWPGGPGCGGPDFPTPSPLTTATTTPPPPTLTATPIPTVSATPICNDGINQPGEPCDPTAPSSGWGACRPDATCTSCTCACPTAMTLTSDAADPATVLDLGWTGIWHRAPLAGDGTLTVQLDCPAADHPCGACSVSGPLPNPQAGAGQLDNRRCSTDPSKHCASDATCAARTCLGGANDGASCGFDSECPGGTCPLAGTCIFHASAPLPIAAGGVALCLVQRFVGPVGGTVDVDTGAAAIATTLGTGVYSPISIDVPCPRCSDAGGFNDGVAGGTCDGGPRQGLPCDANAVVPGRPDFGRTSLDCPPLPAALKGDLVMALDNATEVMTRTLTTASPACTASGSFNAKCLCDTCNNADAEPCFSNADCPPSGGNPGVCGGRRCLGGANVGTPCIASSECPGSVCGRPGGVPTAPTSCIDDYTGDGMVACADANGDDEGECVVGPTDQTCSLASGHAQRGCSSDAECGGAPGSCESTQRKCFLTGGGSFQPGNQPPGTDTLSAAGVASAPVAGVSQPTLASVFCVGPVGSPSVNTVVGLPGPARLTVRSTASAQP